jgi:hypothetical protein
MPGYWKILHERAAYPSRTVIKLPQLGRIDLSKVHIPRIADVVSPKDA